LEHYNKKKKVCYTIYSLVLEKNITEHYLYWIDPSHTVATHTLTSSQEQLFFAEILHCSKRRVPDGFIVTCCEPLRPDSAGDQFSFLLMGRKIRRPEGTSAVRNNTDFTYCRMLHPKGENYVAGHCNIPRIYNYLR
ncbi:hypothetical protein BAE44_0000545, partial [Dichanthelium oligosanthes]